MEQNKDFNQFEIPLAKRIYLNNSNSILFKKLLIFSPFLCLFFSLFVLRLIRNIEIGSLGNINFQAQINHDHRILGHLPYAEIPREKLVLIEPNSQVHIDIRDSLIEMRDEAKKNGIYLVFLSGYRSINLQNEIFYSLKSFRNQEAAERARVCKMKSSILLNLLEIRKLQKELEFQPLLDIPNIVLVLQLISVMLLKEKQTLRRNLKIQKPLNG